MKCSVAYEYARAHAYVSVYMHGDNIEGLRNFPCIVANPTSGAEHISRFVIFHVAHFGGPLLGLIPRI